jgi:hypothetical protein
LIPFLFEGSVKAVARGSFFRLNGLVSLFPKEKFGGNCKKSQKTAKKSERLMQAGQSGVQTCAMEPALAARAK